jgi:hypothetical protein
VAYLALDGNKYVMVVDGQPSEKFELIEKFHLHPRTGRVLCTAQNGQNHYLLADGKTLGPYDSVGVSGFCDSGDSYAAVVVRRPMMHCLVNGREGEAFQSIAAPVVFSPEGKHFAYLAERKGGRMAVVVDGTIRDEYEPQTGRDGRSRAAYEREIIFSPDSKRVAYRVRTPFGQWAMNVDGRAFPGGQAVGQFLFSPDSKHFAYIVWGKDGVTLILDGQKHGTYEYVAELQFGPCSQHTCFAAIKGGKRLVMLDDKEGPVFGYGSDISPVSFSPDGRRIMYVVWENDKNFIVVDADRTGPFDVVSARTFSPESRRYACAVQRGKKWLQVIDGKEQRPYDAVWDLAFAPKGDRYAYVARQGKQSFVVHEDGTESPKFETVYNPVFSPDGRLVYQAMTSKHRRMVVDGQDGPAFENIQNIRFTPQGCLVYQGQRNYDWYLVIERQEYGPYTSDLPYAVGTDGSINYVARKSDKWYRVQHLQVK